MTREEVNQKTSLCFLLNPNISEEEKNCVIEKVMATRATIVSKAALCNIITHLLKQNAKLKKNNLKIEIALIVVETIENALMMAVVIISVYGNRSKIQNCKKGRGKVRYYKLNEIYVEYDELRGNFYHWNPITRIGKKDKISERTARKLVANILTPIFEHEFMEMFDHVIWLKTPALEYITIEGCIKI